MDAALLVILGLCITYIIIDIVKRTRERSILRRYSKWISDNMVVVTIITESDGRCAAFRNGVRIVEGDSRSEVTDRVIEQFKDKMVYIIEGER